MPHLLPSRVSFRVLLALLFVPAILIAAEPTAKPSGPNIRQVLVADAKLPRVLLIGDSILGGYHTKTAELLRDKVGLDVWITPKHVGSGDLRTEMKTVFAENTYDVVLFNDSGLHAWQVGRIPEGKYEPLLRAHLASLREFVPKAKLVFATTTPMTTKTKPIEVDTEFNPVIVERNKIAMKVMEDNDVPVADFYGILAKKLDMAAGDRFHWTKPAYELLAQCAATRIAEALGLPLPPSNTAIVPVPKLENDCYDWYARHEAVLKVKDQINPEIVMIGDSITHFWGGPPEFRIQNGARAWKDLFGERRVLNLGFGWDRTQNVLWRLEHGEFDGLRPRYVVLNIGTNNFSGTANARANSPAEVAEGIKAICQRIREKSPESRIILMGVLPRGQKANDPFRAKILELNKLLAEVGKTPGVTFLDIGPQFLSPDGELPRKFMGDYCHPSEEGYALWAAALKPLLQEPKPSSTAAPSPAEPEKIALWPEKAPVGDNQFENANAFVTVHRPAAGKANGAAVVICPGGGYRMLVSGPEGHGIAQWLNQHGITGIVLEYRLPQGRPQVPLLDAQRAIRAVRFSARQSNIDPNRIGIMGFSAGGHLAATAATHFDGGDVKASDPIERVSCRPDFAVLVYPVISMGEKHVVKSREILLGSAPKPELVELFSNEKQVTDKTPPVFLAHAKDDAKVSPEHSRMFFEALKAHRVAAEYLELPSGGHGLDGYKGPMWDAWQAKSLEWLKSQKFLTTGSPSASKQ